MLRVTVALLLLGTLAGQHARAQEALISGRDIALTAVATVGAIGLSREDSRMARVFSDSGFHARHTGFETAAKRASFVTETVLMGTGGLVYGIARWRKGDGTADVALHSTESVAGAAMFIQVVRGALGRARPYLVDDNGKRRDGEPYDFDFLHGFTSFNYRSFPSMHAMASFAVASALTEEMRVRHTPDRQVIGPALYVGAAMPALARMYLDEHWLSDIGMGVFLGVLSGQKVVLYSHAHPNNVIDRRFLRPRVQANVRIDARGVSFAMSPF
ncbi:MAG: phosphatase PAP2 family protein [Gemmatimonadales bacterium]